MRIPLTFLFPQPIHIPIHQRVIKLRPPRQAAPREFLLIVINRHKDVLYLVGHFFRSRLIEVLDLILFEEEVVLILVALGDFV